MISPDRPSGEERSFTPTEAGGESPLQTRPNDVATVLVVEDERVTRDFFVAALRQAGFDVDIAVDGLEAIGRLESKAYDALVLDLHLPRLDGMGVLRFLSERHPELLRRVALVTGLSVQDVASLYPICGTLPKPVSASRLVEIVRECLTRNG